VVDTQITIFFLGSVANDAVLFLEGFKGFRSKKLDGR